MRDVVFEPKNIEAGLVANHQSDKKKSPEVIRALVYGGGRLTTQQLAIGASDQCCGSMHLGHLFTSTRTLLDGEKLGAALFISVIIFASSTYFSAMSGEMTTP